MSRQKPLQSNNADIKEIITSSTLEVILEAGVLGATYRRIAAKAGISPGTMTYHFENINEILAAAFTKMARDISSIYMETLSAAKDIDQAKEVVADLICGDLWKTPGQMLLIFELYAFVTREPQYRPIMSGWMKDSRQALERHFDTKIATALDALIEGFTIHNALGNKPIDRTAVLEIINQLNRS
jgi:DNA-binding transcriptional regulator YbjK